MARDEQGRPTPQCDAVYERDGRFVHCVRPREHDGAHEDARGEWRNERAPGTQRPVPD